ncbi:MAG TPA: ABC transporter ATP-binding protein [Polyangiaceae bacterium]|nr:ABC transporter ATP-binding protein [Polyangiaceae bacterium]
MSPPPPARKEPARSLGAQLRESLEHTRMTLRLVWRSSRAMTIALGAMTAGGALVPLGIAYAGKRIVDAVVVRSTAGTLRWVLVELALVVATAVVQRGLGLVRSLLGARLGIDINVTILEKALGLELRFFEDPDFYDKLTRARREASSRPIALVTESFGLVQSFITLVGYGVLLVHFSGWAVMALCAATVPATVAEMRFSKVAFKIRNWRSPEARRLLYLEYVLANDEHAKEVKLFGLGPMLLGRYRAMSEQFYAEDSKLYVRRAVWTQILSLIGTGTFYGAYAVMALMAARGDLTLGNMTMYVLAFRQGQQAFQSALAAIGDMYEHNLYMANLWEYLRIAGAAATLPEGLRGGGATTWSGVPSELSPRSSVLTSTANGGIAFEDVGFRYPGKERWALRHVDLAIPGGASLALVGENGAGKTTLVKLLTRLYEPTEGRIVLDGRDLREWDPEALRKRFGVLFQDFNQYQLKVRENVGMGSIDHLEDVPRIERAVERGGATEVVAALVGGLEAPLGRWFQDGSELSGGQWQKVALARAFMREEADILVLDEPTAALDAEAEHAVFQRFRELAQGRTTIVISHRFPTVRMASRIVVLDGGAIVESGTHDELVAKGGKYARMFALQAAGYQ